MTYSESDLIIPALALLLQHSDGLTTSDIIAKLEAELDLSEEDQRILSGRNDSHFSQKVRNLMGSHRDTNALGRHNLAEYEEIGNARVHRITEAGKSYLLEHGNDYSFIMNSGFSESQRKDVIDRDFKDLIIEEGFTVAVPEKAKRKRSRKLTEIARKHFTENDIIRCKGCKFSFNEFYGDSARNYIEVHHLKPIFTYQEEDISKSVDEALKNLAPLCANCHRMMHRKTTHVLSIDELHELITTHGTFAS
jgi:5-methylcytosine-specific restriction enzyme A